jgi:hypothetical protein
MSRFGNLIGGKTPAPAPAPVVEPTPAPLVEDVVVSPEEEVLTEASPLEQMSKKQLENYGREHGIELDRRHSRSKLVEELKDHLTNS